MEPGDNAAALREFLATRDVACLVCGYNLRALRAPQCPECGEGLNVELLRALDDPRPRPLTRRELVQTWARVVLWTAIMPMTAAGVSLGLRYPSAFPARGPPNAPEAWLLLGLLAALAGPTAAALLALLLDRRGVERWARSRLIRAVALGVFAALWSLAACAWSIAIYDL